MKNKVPFIEQMEHSECGLACLAMILGYHGFHITLPELRDQFGTSKKGTSLYHLAEIGKYYHLNNKVYQGNCSQLHQVSMPAIIFWEQKHFVVLEKIHKHHISILDPANGRQKISLDAFKESYSGYIMAFQPDPAFTKRKKEKTFNFLLTHLVKQKKILLGITLVSILLQTLGLLTPKLTQWITDEVIMAKNEDHLAIIGFMMIAIYLFYQLFSVLRVFMIGKLQTLMDSSLMSAFIAKLFSLPYSFFETRTSGDLIYRANSNVFIREILSFRAISLVIDTLLIIGYGIMLFYLNWQLSFIVIALCSVIVLSMVISTQWVKKLSAQTLSVQVKTQSYLTESIHGIGDIKVLGAEQKVFKQWQTLFHNQLHFAQKQNNLTALLESFTVGIQFITPLLLFWVGTNLLLQGDFSLGQLLGFNALAASFMVPIVSMGGTYSQFLLLRSYIQRLEDVMNSQSESKNYKKIKNFAGSIELENLSFKYDAFGKENLSSITLTIKPGEKIAIVGKSGSGKSTLAKLLLGLYRPTQGTILFDGTPLEELDFQDLRNHIGAVLQETRLFHGNVLENIQLLNEQISLEKVIQAAKIADIHEEILKQPMGYYTMISEGGGNFSGGQRQRLLLARALVNNPKLLILDEATSALDNLSESLVQEHLQQLNCTQIIIAHRLSTIVHADRILVLQDGKIAEMGTHHELLLKKGFYYDLYTSKKENKNEEMAI